MSRPTRITDSEWTVMEVLWDAAPQSARDVTAALDRRRRWKAQTVKTLLARLVNKGAVTYDVDGKRFLYQPVLSREDATAAEATSFLERVCRGSLTPVLTHAVESKRPLGEDELAALRRLLDENQKGGK